MKRMTRLDRVLFASIVLALLLLLSTGQGNHADSGNRESSAQVSDEMVRDCDGNVYRTVRIGTQVWMAENLRVTHYRDGTPIPHAYDNADWTHAADGAYCTAADDSTEYKESYGLLYNFHAVSNSHELCPDGWHVPSEAECMTLIDHLGGRAVAGGKLKDGSSDLWRTGTRRGTNESGFTGLPAGGRGSLGGAGDVGYYATWWSSTSCDTAYAWHWGLYPDKDGIRSNPGHKASGFSVRCIKD